MRMRREYKILLIAVATVVAGIVVGMIIGGKNKTSPIEPEAQTKLARETKNLENEVQMVETSVVEVKTSPNTLFVFETYYKGCKHTTIERNEILAEYVNQTEEDLQEPYRDWKIKGFTTEEVTFYQEKEGICGEHYIIRENNGYIAIYQINSLGTETLKETTEIVTSYLPETDRLRLKEGIQVEGQENLNATIEDYE